MMESQKVALAVILAKARIHNHLRTMDSGLRRNDGKSIGSGLLRSLQL